MFKFYYKSHHRKHKFSVVDDAQELEDKEEDELNQCCQRKQFKQGDDDHDRGDIHCMEHTYEFKSTDRNCIIYLDKITNMYYTDNIKNKDIINGT